MGGQSFPTSNKVVRCSGPIAVGTTLHSSDGINCAGFDECTFLVQVGAITDGTPDVHVQASDDDGSSDAYSDIAGSEVTAADTDDDSIISVTVRRPVKKWLRAQITRGGSTGSVVEGMIAILSIPELLPITEDATVAVSGNQWNPAEGTK